MIFSSRQEAGKLLAEKFVGREGNFHVLAIPRGGVIIGAEIAQVLKCPLSLIITRKLGAPGNPELAIGATTSSGGLVLDRELVRKLKIPATYVEEEEMKQIAEARRREVVYSQALDPNLTGKIVILTDDGIATGATVEAAIHAIRNKLPEKIILAIPVAPSSTIEELKVEVDELIALQAPDDFYAIGEFYLSFPQLTDEEVIKTLKQAQ